MRPCEAERGRRKRRRNLRISVVRTPLFRRASTSVHTHTCILTRSRHGERVITPTRPGGAPCIKCAWVGSPGVGRSPHPDYPPHSHLPVHTSPCTPPHAHLPIHASPLTGCPRVFHFECLVPPMRKADMPEGEPSRSKLAPKKNWNQTSVIPAG